VFSALGSIGIFLALSSALVYGGADFVGGLATRRSSQYQVLALSSLAGVFLMIVFAFIWGEDWPPLKAFWWATLAGLAGALGLAVLYYGLSCGQAAIVSPVSGVLSAVLPVIFAAVTDSLPTPVQLAGFILAVPAIWLVSAGQPGQEARTKSGVVLGLLAGVAFGFFFILISQV